MPRRLCHIFIFLLAAALSLLPISATSAEEPDEAQAWLVQLNSPLPAALTEADGATFISSIYAPHNLYRITDPSLLELLQEEGMLSWYETDAVVELHTEGEEDSETDSAQWYLDLLNTERGNTLGCYGQGIRIAVIDSGCAQHDELAHALLPGYNYLSDSTDTTDNIGHGTFVSGLIAAADDGTGITGAAPDATIVPLKCFDNGVSTRVSTLTAAIYAAVDEYDCQIINMSFGVKSYSEALDTAISYAVDNGVVCVASAGNSGGSSLYYPAALPNVIGVGSVDSDSTVSSFSQRNNSLSVVAPGRDIYSTATDGGYTYNNGTSFSAPLISALCARLLTADETLTPQEIMQLLTASATDLGDEGYDTSYGYGLANLDGAFSLLLADTTSFLSPFRLVEEELQITLYNNSEEVFSGQCMFILYQGELMDDILWLNLRISPGDTMTLRCPTPDDTLTCVFWPSYSDTTPIMPYQEYKTVPST